MTVRAKFKVQTITRQRMYDGSGELQTIRLTPVISGSPENEQFYKYTPVGQIELGTINAEVGSEFVLDGEYFVDFTKA